MSHDDDAGGDALAGIDLHKWQVPPPPADQRPTILVRALTPATVAKRRRVGWAVAAVLVLNAALAAIIAIIIVRPPSVTTVPRPAGPAFDEHTRELLRELDEQQRELEERQRELDRRLAELQELRALVEQLSGKLRTVQQRDKRPRPMPKQREALVTDTSCDEVACVLDKYRGACCAKFKLPVVGNPIANPTSTLPENLDRTMISDGIAAVRARIAACGERSSAHGRVKARVEVNADGKAIRISIEQTPDALLGACVAGVLRGATFGKSQQGGSFSYPFVF